MRPSLLMLLTMSSLLARSQAVMRSTQLQVVAQNSELADDVTRHQRVVRSKLECASACAENQHYCMTFSACKLGSGLSIFDLFIINLKLVVKVRIKLAFDHWHVHVHDYSACVWGLVFLP